MQRIFTKKSSNRTLGCLPKGPETCSPRDLHTEPRTGSHGGAFRLQVDDWAEVQPVTPCHLETTRAHKQGRRRATFSAGDQVPPPTCQAMRCVTATQRLRKRHPWRRQRPRDARPATWACVGEAPLFQGRDPRRRVSCGNQWTPLGC